MILADEILTTPILILCLFGIFGATVILRQFILMWIWRDRDDEDG
jgi:hypothetical protein